MEGGRFQNLQGHTPQAEQVCSDLSVAGAENFLFNLPEWDLSFGSESLSSAVLFPKIPGKHDLANIVQQPGGERLLCLCAISGLQQNQPARVLRHHRTVLPKSVDGKIRWL